MDYIRLEKQLEFLREIDKAKSVFRNTILLDSSRRENDAEHSWHMAICAMLFVEYLNEPINNMGRLLQMIMLHDAIEIYAGDTFAYGNNVSTQHEREIVAADELFSILPEDQSKEFRSLWDEFEEYNTSESKCAHLVDTFMPVYHNYITKGQKWRELGVTKDKILAKCGHIKNGSEEIYNFICTIIDDAVQKGYLPVK